MGTIVNKRVKLRLVSLFAGIGGFELGFKDLDVKVVWSNEIDKFACKTYRANFPTHNLVEGDIRKINVEDIPRHDILVGGFPCQTFSIAQNVKEKKGLNDPRGHLFKEILRVLAYHKPKWFLLENVKGLTFKNNKEAFDLIVNGLIELGYKVVWKVLNAKDYGVPQNRERIYFIGNRLDIDFVWPIPIEKSTRISDILEKEVEEKYYLSDKTWEGMKERKSNGHSAFGLFSENDQHTATLRARYYKDGSEILLFNETRKRGEIKVSENNVCPTLRAGMGMGGGIIPYIFQNWRYKIIREYKENSPCITSGNVAHIPFVKNNNKNPRKLTPRECARLQGFGDDFKIVCSDMQTYKQFGNAVAVPVIKKLAEKIKELWKTMLQK